MKKLFIGLGIAFLIIVILLTVMLISGFLKAYAVEPVISDFYHQYNMQNVSYIYNTMFDKKLKDITPAADFEKFVKGVYQALGPTKEWKKGAWKIWYATDGIYLDIQYSVTHEKGTSTDSFTLKKHNNSWLITHYHINSGELAKLVSELNKKPEIAKEPVNKLADNAELTPHTEDVIKTFPISTETIAEKNNVTDTSSLSDIRLSATTASGAPESRIAVINNAIYHIGDSVAGYKIDEIKDGCVVLIDNKGAKHEIHI